MGFLLSKQLRCLYHSSLQAQNDCFQLRVGEAVIVVVSDTLRGTGAYWRYCEQRLRAITNPLFCCGMEANGTCNTCVKKMLSNLGLQTHFLSYFQGWVWLPSSKLNETTPNVEPKQSNYLTNCISAFALSLPLIHFCYSGGRKHAKIFYKILFHINRATATLQKHIESVIKTERQLGIFSSIEDSSPSLFFHRVFFNSWHIGWLK